MGTTRRIPVRKCDRCGELTPLDDLVETLVENMVKDVVILCHLCLLCATSFRREFLWGGDPDYTYWFRTP
jgi:hypothetical protein